MLEIVNKIIYPNKVAAIVVTYNRLELLKQVVNGLLNQTLQPSKIIIINNNSSDGTKEWLEILIKEYSHITIINQENTGSSGGQHTGTKAAYEMGYEWIWTMDDDAMPAPECLENLMLHCRPDLVCHPYRINCEEKKFAGLDIAKINMTNPFKKLKQIFDISDFKNEEIIPVDIVTFEGPIFHHSMFEKVGFPDKDFFIFADDTDFSIRLSKKGIQFAIITKAVLNRLLPFYIITDFDDWKFYYQLRNLTALDTLYGNLPVRLFRSFIYVLKRIPKCRKLSHFKLLFKAYFDGYFYKQNSQNI